MTNPLKVSQAAREAAADHGGWDDFRSGQWDAHPLVQSFTRFEAQIREEYRVKDAARGQAEMDHMYRTTCACTTAERYVDYCPQHGSSAIRENPNAS